MAGNEARNHGSGDSEGDAASADDLEQTSRAPSEETGPSHSVELVAAQIVRSEHALFRGPLPPPEVLAEYETTLPGAADRILAMAERQAAHRQELEATVVAGDSRRQIIGLAAGALVTLSALALAGVLAYFGHSGVSALTALAPIATLAGVFVYGDRSRRRERERRLEETLAPTPASSEASEDRDNP